MLGRLPQIGKTEEHCLENRETSENTRAMHEENFLISWLMDDTESKAEEVEEMKKKANEEEATSGNRESEGGQEKVEMDCASVSEEQTTGRSC